MATRSHIGILRKDGTIEAVYSHYDGYPSGVGKTLRDHYTDKDKIEKLLDLGNVSSLEKNITKPEGHSFSNRIDGFTTFYGRDRGDKEQEARMYDKLIELQATDYTYIWDDEKDKWFFTDNYEDKSKRIDLATADLDKFAKGGEIKPIEFTTQRGDREFYETYDRPSKEVKYGENEKELIEEYYGEVLYEDDMGWWIDDDTVVTNVMRKEYARGGMTGNYYLTITPSEFSDKVERILDYRGIKYTLDPDKNPKDQFGTYISDGYVYTLDTSDYDDIEDVMDDLEASKENDGVGNFSFHKNADDPGESGYYGYAHYKKGGAIYEGHKVKIKDSGKTMKVTDISKNKKNQVEFSGDEGTYLIGDIEKMEDGGKINELVFYQVEENEAGDGETYDNLDEAEMHWERLTDEQREQGTLMKMYWECEDGVCDITDTEIIYGKGGTLHKSIKHHYGLGGYLASGAIGAYLGAKNPTKVRKVTDPLDKAFSDIGKNFSDKKYEKGGRLSWDEWTEFVDNLKEGDVVFNKETKKIGKVTQLTDKAFWDHTPSVLTDVDGYVSTTDLEPYDERVHKNYKKFAEGGDVEDKEYVLDHYYVYVHKEVYEEGETDNVHNWDSSDYGDNDKTFSSKSALMDFIQEVVYRDTSVLTKNEDFSIDSDDDETTIDYAVLCKYNKLGRGYDYYSKASDEEIEKWKKGDLELFSVGFTFKVKVYEPRKKVEFAEGGSVKDNKNAMITGGILGVLLGVFLNR